jgi:hypothetical protein
VDAPADDPGEVFRGRDDLYVLEALLVEIAFLLGDPIDRLGGVVRVGGANGDLGDLRWSGWLATSQSVAPLVLTLGRSRRYGSNNGWGF